jgi:hypothetical protein
VGRLIWGARRPVKPLFGWFRDFPQASRTRLTSGGSGPLWSWRRALKGRRAALPSQRRA